MLDGGSSGQSAGADPISAPVRSTAALWVNAPCGLILGSSVGSGLHGLCTSGAPLVRVRRNPADFKHFVGDAAEDGPPGHRRAGGELREREDDRARHYYLVLPL